MFRSRNQAGRWYRLDDSFDGPRRLDWDIEAVVMRALLFYRRRYTVEMCEIKSSGCGETKEGHAPTSKY